MMNGRCYARVTEWSELLGSGDEGEVYRVKCQRKVQQRRDSSASDRQGPKLVWGGDFECAAKLMRLKRSSKLPLIDKVNEMCHDLDTFKVIEHENIISMLDHILIPDSETYFPYSTLIILMDLCHGNLIDIHHQFSDPNDMFIMPISLTQRFITDVSTGLHCMHHLNAVHLDIKPENILFKWDSGRMEVTRENLLQQCNNLTFKLGDLGSSIIFGEGKPAVTTVYTGTPVYMPPEMQALGKGNATPIEAKPCDIYSLGMTFGYFVTDFKVYDRHLENGTVQEYFEEIVQLRLYREGLTKEMVMLIINMIHLDWRDRYDIDQLMNYSFLTTTPTKKRKD